MRPVETVQDLVGSLEARAVAVELPDAAEARLIEPAHVRHQEPVIAESEDAARKLQAVRHQGKAIAIRDHLRNFRQAAAFAGDRIRRPRERGRRR